ncbi:MAG: aspartate aminotransferase family protein [Hyphomicrobiales bacterium]
MSGSIFGTYSLTEFALVKGQGTRVWADNGQEYLDFGAGIAVNSLGHAHPHLVETLQDQATKLWHVSNLYRIAGQERLADRLTDATFADKVFFCNSGAEAMECAIKVARKYHAEKGNPERYKVVTFEGAFHGRTLATIAAGGQEKHLAGFGPKVEGFDQVPFEDVDALNAAITPETAAILIEPIQGEGGVRPVSGEFLRKLRKICDEHGLLLIFDEVQTGMGRTGTLFAHEQAGVTPDIMGTAKGIGGGFPLGACLATEDAASGMTVGSHGSTFGGNPLACAVGNAVLDIMLEDGFLASVREKARSLNQKLGGLVGSHPDVFEAVTGEGLLLGLKCKKPVGEVMNMAVKHGLLTVSAGNNVLRLAPPLVVSDEEIEKAVKLLDEAACELEAETVGE